MAKKELTEREEDAVKSAMAAHTDSNGDECLSSFIGLLIVGGWITYYMVFGAYKVSEFAYHIVANLLA